jgi:hypothetical protein
MEKHIMATETVTPQEISGTSESLLRGLFKRAEDRLTDDELRTVAILSEEAYSIVGHIECLCNGIGCLVAADSDRQAGERAGNFQSGGDVANLLWALGGMAGYAKGLMNVADWAGAAQENRARNGASAGAAKRKEARHG